MRATLASCCVLSAVAVAGDANARDEPAPDIAGDPLAQPGNEYTPGKAPSPTISLVQVTLNGNRLSHPIFVATKADDIYLPLDVLSGLNIQDTNNRTIIDGKVFVPAGSLNAEEIVLDSEEDTLRIQCTADCFREALISAAPEPPPALSPVSTGMFVNYDVFAQGGDIDSRAGTLLEAGVFTGNGSGIANIACTDDAVDENCVRLDTSWTIDRPDTTTRLSIGDTTTGAASWGAPARFGGVRWGTDFSLLPDFITFPTPSLSGDATLPGVVDVIVNDAHSFTADVSAGPFSLTDVPVVTGAGSAQLVLTDVLGRQSIVTADYYAAPQLLKPGLKEWSLEAGFLRERYGLRSNQYDEGFLAGSYALGVTDRFTWGTRSELSAEQQSAGVSAAFLNPSAGVFQASAAMSQTDGNTGGLIDLRHEWRSSTFSLGSSVSYTTEQFRQFGQAREPPRLTARSFANYSDRQLGTLSLTWTHRDERIQDDFSTLGLRYTRSLGTMSFNVSALRLLGASDATIATLSLSIPLGGNTSSGVGMDYRDGRIGGDFRYGRSAPPAGGLGYYGRASIDGIDRYEAGADYRTRFGDAAAALSQADDRTAARLTLRGGAAFIDGTLIAAPSITDSLAIVTVGQEPGVHVYQDRQPVGTTDKHGRIVLTRLRPFERNAISFNPLDVGLDAAFATTEMILVPGLRTGHRVEFGVTQSRGVMAYVVDPDGAPISSQGRIADADTGETYPIGQGGRVYIADAKTATRLKFVRNRTICEAQIRLRSARSSGPYEHVGNIVCTPISALR